MVLFFIVTALLLWIKYAFSGEVLPAFTLGGCLQLLAAGDRVVFTSGEHMETHGATNTLRLLEVGNDGRASGLGDL